MQSNLSKYNFSVASTNRVSATFSILLRSFLHILKIGIVLALHTDRAGLSILNYIKANEQSSCCLPSYLGITGKFVFLDLLEVLYNF
jgi:hypothetical protein